jgi:hypothetical protein
MDLTGLMNKKWLPFSVLLTTVIDVGTWLPYWRLMIARATHLSSLNLLQGEESLMSLEEHLITSCKVAASECHTGISWLLYFNRASTWITFCLKSF